MSPEKQRIEIAKIHLGLEDFDRLVSPMWEGRKLFGTTRSDPKWKLVPDYLNDLNAMHDAEKVLNPPPSDVPVDASAWSREWESYNNWIAMLTPIGTWIRATASRRAEAFLRTIGKWEE